MMAEEDGGSSGSGIKGMLTRKVGGVPIYVYGAILVLGLAWYLKRRAAANATTSGTDTTGQNASANQTFPNAGAMPWSADVFINQTGGTASTDNGPKALTVPEGTHVADFLQQVNATYPNLGLTRDKLMQLNPNLALLASNNYGYLSSGNPGGQSGSGPTIESINTGMPNTQVRIQ